MPCPKNKIWIRIGMEIGIGMATGLGTGMLIIIKMSISERDGHRNRNTDGHWDEIGTGIGMKIEMPIVMGVRTV